MKKNKMLPVLEVRDPAQRKALTSPIRLEIIGLFAGHRPLSVADIANRMKRPATALYYHVNHMLELGLLIEAGIRPKGKRDEVLYLPAAERFEVCADNEDSDQNEELIETLAVAQRMALRDMRATLESDTAQFEGPGRNCHALRLHAQLSPDSLAKVNEHLDAVIDVLVKEGNRPDAESSGFYSLTLALMPLKGRHLET